MMPVLRGGDSRGGKEVQALRRVAGEEKDSLPGLPGRN